MTTQTTKTALSQKYYKMRTRVEKVLPHSQTDIENFISPNLALILAPGFGIDCPPLATAMLTTFARQKGYKVLPIDLNIEFFHDRKQEFQNIWEPDQASWFWNNHNLVEKMATTYSQKLEDFVDLIIDTDVPVIGFTIYSSSFCLSRILARKIKQKKPEIIIIFGGPNVSRPIAGEYAIKDPAIDIVVQGEGELTLIDVLNRIQTGASLEDCPGLLVLHNGEILETGDRELIDDLDQLPIPFLGDFNINAYKYPQRLALITSRGCLNQCIFCDERHFWKKYRHRSAQNVFSEIQHQLKLYPAMNFIDFQDSLINGSLKELNQLAELIIDNELKIKWTGQTIIRKDMDYALLTKLKLSGCIHLCYGLETPSASLMLKTGKVMSKGADVEEIAEAHRKAELSATYNFMFGLPGETEEDAFETLEFLRRNTSSTFGVNPSPIFCAFSFSASICKTPEKYGVDLSKGWLYWETLDKRNTYLTRLKRFEDFCKVVKELNIPTTYPHTKLLDRDRQLGMFFLTCDNKERAYYYLSAWLKKHPEDKQAKEIYNKLKASQITASLQSEPQKIAVLQEKLADTSSLVKDLKHSIHVAQKKQTLTTNELQYIKTSKMWILMKATWKIRNKLIPKGSFRRELIFNLYHFNFKQTLALIKKHFTRK